MKLRREHIFVGRNCCNINHNWSVALSNTQIKHITFKFAFALHSHCIGIGKPAVLD